MPELLTLRKEKTSSLHGKPPAERTIEEHIQNGIVNLDKPAGPTSFQTVEFVKSILGIKKAGHAGTLDPGVSGILVVGINDGTKILQAQLEAPKEYVCLMYTHDKINPELLNKTLAEFKGPLFHL